MVKVMCYGQGYVLWSRLCVMVKVMCYGQGPIELNS